MSNILSLVAMPISTTLYKNRHRKNQPSMSRFILESKKSDVKYNIENKRCGIAFIFYYIFVNVQCVLNYSY